MVIYIQIYLQNNLITYCYVISMYTEVLRYFIVLEATIDT